jgi:hypothetical protein
MVRPEGNGDGYRLRTATEGPEADLSFRVWFQTGALACGIGALFAALFVAITGSMGYALGIGAFGLLTFGFASRPIPCPNCGNLFPFAPSRPWATKLPEACPRCQNRVKVAGVRPPLSLLSRGLVFVGLTAVLIGAALLADKVPYGGALWIGLRLLVAMTGVAQYYFVRIFLRGN